MAAAAASTGAADSEAIAKNNSEAAEATVASQAQETKGKDNEILALIQERKTIAKHEKERIREISQKIKNVSETTRGGQDRNKFRRSWKISREQGTSPVSSRWRNESSSPKSKTEQARPSKRGKESQMSFRNSMKICTKEKKDKKDKDTDLRTEEHEKTSGRHDHIPEFTKNEIQDAIDRLRKGKLKDSSGVRAEQLKNCSDATKEKSEKSSTKSYDKRIAPRRVGAKFVPQAILQSASNI